jgi:4a-hydroxytetrahydrobiopterin dehydratase
MVGHMTEVLDEDALAAARADIPDWAGDTHGLTRRVSLPTFPIAVAVVDEVAVAAEAANHHPDIDIRWRTLTFSLSTHDAGGRVTARDIGLARRIDAIVAAHL